MFLGRLTRRQPSLYKPSLAPSPSSPLYHTPLSLPGPTRRNLHLPPRHLPGRARGNGQENPEGAGRGVQSPERGGGAIRRRQAWRGGRRRRPRGL